MLKSILPSSKNDYLQLKQEIENLTEDNQNLKNKLENIEKNNVKRVYAWMQGIYPLFLYLNSFKSVYKPLLPLL